MALQLIDDFTGAEIDAGTGWELKNARGQVFHFQNLSGLFRVLATEGKRIGLDDDRALPKIAGYRVTKAPEKKGK